MIKPYVPKQSKYFKTPKYTGVTLSLLSLFVLASMLVVWQKTTSSIQTANEILVVADSSSRMPVTHGVNEFIYEMNLPVKVSFLPSDGIDSLFKSSLSSDLYLLFGSDFDPIKNSGLFAEVIPIAHKPKPSQPEDGLAGTNSLVNEFVACIPLLSENSENALRLARYLAAPSRGQFQFAKAGWMGVDGDSWERNPKIKIYCVPTTKKRVFKSIRQFESREGISVEIETMENNELEKTVRLISKSNAKSYLPDIILLDDEKLEIKEIPFKQLDSATFLHLETRFQSICQRLLNHLKAS